MKNRQDRIQPFQYRGEGRDITHYSSLIAHCFLVFLLHTAACTKIEEHEAPAAKTEKVPDQESWNSKIILSQEGIVRCVILAGHLEQFEAGEIAKIDEGMEVDFFDEQGEHTSRLTAREGEVHQKTKDLEARGDVVIISDDGVRLRTDHIRWDNARQKILAPGEVTLATDQGTETGVGLEADAGFSHWTMREVTGRSEERFEKLPQSKE
jgi:LPS export ABC transporter protein LptC